VVTRRGGADRPAPRRSATGRTAVVLGLLLVCSLVVGEHATGQLLPTASTSYLYAGFGTGGEAFLTPSTVSSQARAVTVVPPCPATGFCAYANIRNDTVAAGYEGTAAGGTDFAVAVVNPGNGQPISNFNGGNLFVNNFGAGSGSTVDATAVAVYPPCPSAEPTCPWAHETGDIIVAGTTAASGSPQTNVEVAALSPTGAVEWSTSFAPTGYSVISVGAAALDTGGGTADGDVVVVGSANVSGGGGQVPLIAALTPTGAVDTNFGVGGSETSFVEPTGAPPAGETLQGVAVDGDGNIVVDGTFTDNNNNPTIVVARYLPTGAFDKTFGIGPVNCAGSATCSGSTQVGTSDLGGGLGLQPVSGTCTGQPGCYDIVVGGTGSPNAAPSSIVVAGVTETGAVAPGFGTGVVTAYRPTSGPGATASSIAVQRVAGENTGLLVSGYVAGTTSPGTAIVTRLTSTGGVVTTFGTNGTYVIPSGRFVDAQALGITALPGTLDFIAVGALAGSTDIVSRFAMVRLIGELITMSASVVVFKGHQDVDIVTVQASASAPAPVGFAVTYSLQGEGGIFFASSSGKVQLNAGQTVGRVATLIYYAPLVGNGTVTVTTSGTTGGFSSVTSPAKFAVPAPSPFGPAPPEGYWMITSTGGVYAFRVPFKGALAHLPPSPIVNLAETPSGNGYWLATAAGGIYGFGAKYEGGLSKTPVSPIVAIAADPASPGYWLFGSGGQVYAFGVGTKYYGGPKVTSSPVVAAGAAPDGLGYWVVLANGSVYGFGPGAKYQGGVVDPPAPIVAMAPDVRTGGYWLVTETGHVYAFNAPYDGSATGQHATSISEDPGTNGYWVALANGGVYSFSAKFYGSAANYHPHGAVVTLLGR
jgi:hypothetical protein